MPRFRKYPFILLTFLLVSILLFCACDYSVVDTLAEDGLMVFFIDVGQADSALVLCEGESMLIDGGNAADSDLIYTFLKNMNMDHLNYIVATHAHEDHVGGLSGALNYASVDTAFCPVTEYDSRAFNSFVKYLNEQGKEITIPKSGDTFNLGSAEVTILGPVKEYEDANNISIVLKITYGETSFLFTGDAERDAEADILEAGYDLKSNVLKVGHHGSNTSTSYPFLREIMPEYAVISCGKDNSYGHPHEDALSRLRDAEVNVYRTDLQGTVVCRSNGKTVAFATERNEDVQTNPTEKAAESEGLYIGNINSKKFHRPTCSGLPNENNRIVLETRDEALENGYTACGICKP